MVSIEVTFRNSELVDVTEMYFPCPKVLCGSLRFRQVPPFPLIRHIPLLFSSVLSRNKIQLAFYLFIYFNVSESFIL